MQNALWNTLGQFLRNLDVGHEYTPESGSWICAPLTWKCPHTQRLAHKCVYQLYFEFILSWKWSICHFIGEETLVETSSMGRNSVQFSCSVVSDSLQPHGLQHARPPCPSPTPRTYSNSCPLSQWCHPTISSSVIPFFFCLQSFPASGSFQIVIWIRWPKYWSFSFSISPSNEYSELISFRIDWLEYDSVTWKQSKWADHKRSGEILNAYCWVREPVFTESILCVIPFVWHSGEAMLRGGRTFVLYRLGWGVQTD